MVCDSEFATSIMVSMTGSVDALSACLSNDEPAKQKLASHTIDVYSAKEASMILNGNNTLTSGHENVVAKRRSRKRKFDALELARESKELDDLSLDFSSASDGDPLCAEACTLWSKGPSCPKCSFCNSYRHSVQGCEHLIQQTSALGRYIRDLVRSDPRRVRGWFAIYLKDCPNAHKLACITELLYRRACQQGVWVPIRTTELQWPCNEEASIREFMVVCSAYPTLWMTPSELLLTKKALMNEVLLFQSAQSSMSSSPHGSPSHSLSEEEQPSLIH